MNINDFGNLDFRKKPRIPKRVIFMAGLMINLWLFWRFVPTQLVFWLSFPFVALLGIMASFGWKHALLAFRIWLDQTLGEDWR